MRAALNSTQSQRHFGWCRAVTFGGVLKKKRARLPKQTKIGISILAALSAAVLVMIGLLAVRDQEMKSVAVAANQTFTPAPLPTPTDTAESPVAVAPPLQVKRPVSGPLRALFAGDSLTGSYFATTEDEGFRPLLVKAMSQTGEVAPVGLGVPHGRLSEVQAGTEIPSGAQLAIVEVGTNDFGKTQIPDFRAQYDALLNGIESESPGVAFLCTGLWRAGAEVNNGIRGEDYDNAIKASCEAKGGRYVPLHPIYDNMKMRGPEGVMTWIGKSDTFHPNDDGHAAIANAIARAIHIS